MPAGWGSWHDRVHRVNWVNGVNGVHWGCGVVQGVVLDAGSLQQELEQQIASKRAEEERRKREELEEEQREEAKVCAQATWPTPGPRAHRAGCGHRPTGCRLRASGV
jgi:membrane protein involved in colicin uptake